MRSDRVIVLVIVAVFAASYISAVAWAEDGTPAKEAPVNLSLKNVSIKEGIDALFEGRGLKYYIQPGVTGQIVELKLSGVTFEQALRAMVDAADLSYTVQDGSYIIGPGKPKPASSPPEPAPSVQTPPAQPGTGQYVPPPVQGLAPIQPGPTTQVNVNQAPAPVYYGSPGDLGYGYPYGIPQIYQAGNLRFVYGWPPVRIAGGDSSILSFGPMIPPPGWVSPDMLRFLRGYYAVNPRPYFIPGY
ncbi:MAG: STN domain-containing protein [Armatimonadetes bacterium]|nr:STN domain-containing protein [Armatimonadota bacterium]